MEAQPEQDLNNNKSNSNRSGCYIKNLNSLQNENPNPHTTIPLKHIDYDIQVTDGLANVTLQQIYSNPFKKYLQIEFSFPIDPTICVYKFVAKFGSKRIQGIVKEKQQAKQEYKQAVRQHKQAVYAQIDQTNKDIMNMEIGNLGPGEQLKITISYLQELTVQQNTFYHFQIPSTVSPQSMRENLRKRQPQFKQIAQFSYTWTFKITLYTSRELIKYFSHSHKLQLINQNEQQTETILCLPKQQIPNKDLSLLFTVYNFHLPSYVLGRTDSSCTAMLSFIPKFCQLSLDDALKAYALKKQLQIDMPAVKGEYIFLLDRSGSMIGNSIQKAKQALVLFLQSLPEDTYFNIVSFGDDSKLMFKQSIKYEKNSFQKAVQIIKKMRADMGGTQILTPLLKILQSSVINGYPKQVFLLTDGAVPNTNDVINLVRRQVKYSRCNSIGIGDGCSEALIKGCAEKGKGKYVFINDQQNPSQKIIQLLESTLTPVIDHVSLKYDQNIIENIVPNPESLPFILKNEFVNFYIAFKTQLSNKTTFKFGYKDSKNKFPFETTIEINPDSQNMPWVDKMAHNKIIKNLERSFKQKKPIEEYMRYVKVMDAKEQVINHSINHQLLSEYTAFICVNKELVDGKFQEIRDTGSQKVKIQPAIREQLIKEPELLYGSKHLPDPLKRPQQPILRLAMGRFELTKPQLQVINQPGAVKKKEGSLRSILSAVGNFFSRSKKASNQELVSNNEQTSILNQTPPNKYYHQPQINQQPRYGCPSGLTDTEIMQFGRKLQQEEKRRQQQMRRRVQIQRARKEQQQVRRQISQRTRYQQYERSSQRRQCREQRRDQQQQRRLKYQEQRRKYQQERRIREQHLRERMTRQQNFRRKYQQQRKIREQYQLERIRRQYQHQKLRQEQSSQKYQEYQNNLNKQQYKPYEYFIVQPTHSTSHTPNPHHQPPIQSQKNPAEDQRLAQLQSETKQKITSITQEKTNLKQMQEDWTKQNSLFLNLKQQISQKKTIIQKDLDLAHRARKTIRQTILEIPRNQLYFARTLLNPHPNIILVMKVLYCLCNRKFSEDIQWAEIKRFMANDFINTVLQLNISDVPNTVRRKVMHKFIKSPDWRINEIKNTWKPGGVLAEWAETQLLYADVLTKLEPIKIQIKYLEDQAIKVQKNLSELTATINELQIKTKQFEQRCEDLKPSTLNKDSEVNEVKCLPCLKLGSQKETSLEGQTQESFCAICFNEKLAESPVVQSECGHIFHLECLKKRLQTKWLRPRINFNFCLCPICRKWIEIPHQNQLYPHFQEMKKLRNTIAQMAVQRLQFQDMLQDQMLKNQDSLFYNRPKQYAMDRYTYLLCFKCKKPFFCGRKNSVDARSTQDHQTQNPGSQFICPKCCDIPIDSCLKHGTDFIEFKCKFCCSYAYCFFWDNTHFCEHCYYRMSQGDYVTKYRKDQLPKCQGPGKCPVGGNHGPNGQERILECAKCVSQNIKSQKALKNQVKQIKEKENITQLKTHKFDDQKGSIDSIKINIEEVINQMNIDGSFESKQLLKRIFPETHEQMLEEGIERNIEVNILVTYAVAKWIEKNHPNKQYSLIVKKAISFVKRSIQIENLQFLDELVQ